jgi:hypothetical protein
MELDPAQCQTVADMLKAAGFGTVLICKDMSGLDRIVEATFGPAIDSTTPDATSEVSGD